MLNLNLHLLPFITGVVSLLGTAQGIRPNPPNGHWIDTWASMPQLVEPGNLPPAPYTETAGVLLNSTIRQTLHATLGGSQIRLTISNAFGATALPITAATIALPANGAAGVSAIQPKTLKKLTFSGRSDIVIPNGGLAVSDPIDFAVKSGSEVSVSLYLKDGQQGNAVTGHPGSRTTSWLARGDGVEAVNLTEATGTAHWYFLSSLLLWTPPSHTTLSIIGDSITDGRGSTTDSNNRWPDQLFTLLQKNPSTSHISIANLAAGGNRVLADGLGPSALSRVERDVLSHNGVGWVLVFEGVNDIGTAAPDPAVQNSVYEALIQAYKQMVARLHMSNIPVFGATITPFMAPSNFTGQPYSAPEREVTRQRINKWIRESGVFDGVVDFDAVVRGKGKGMGDGGESMLDPRYNGGDYLHPNVAGYAAMASAFPVNLFARFRGGVDGFE